MKFFLLILLIIPFSAFSKIIDDDLESFEAINNAVNEVKKEGTKSVKRNTEIVCYHNYKIDCFSTDGPLKHVNTLPLNPRFIDLKFLVYTRNNKDKAFEIHYLKPESLKKIENGTSMAIIVHGLNNFAARFYSLKNALLLKYPTVIIADWWKGAASFVLPIYRRQVANSELVGRQIAVLIDNLITSSNINPKNVHLVGHCLGAHAAGFAGKWSLLKYKWRFQRITALDPASPLFEEYPGSYVTCEDANFVDVIHTSAGNNILLGQLGFTKRIGDIDFYPNGGKKQPTCRFSFRPSCNHNAAIYYMEASITAESKCKFNAFKCESWNDFESHKCISTSDSIMGYESVDLPGRKNHYLKTSNQYPYCNL